ncbi:hypothetical protein LZD49_33265 [Dyadobacter sp. CY261]|uniref:hypothetical protein n=1 Tax=Dyadobacter sp. CY261 TaxID=2907203 RepID=UPI001F38786C|nr:hypothetical protein [Dyadobacter sp. CY261]MCF0075396.1 hypothetical protein [Dyadobacter sp. CY261]
MFYPFKPSRSRRLHSAHSQRLNEKIAAMQRAWAKRLNARARKLPAKRLKILLALAGIIACAVSAGLIYRGISAQQLTLHRFDLPMLFEPVSVPEGPRMQQALEKYLDSLEKAFILDSIQNAKSTISHDTSALH